ncbi:ferritin light chain, oocyte isoform [Phlebotomus argentipes]|uniref:ferritin light chain, oocyte isoform n=1 Tax=Phlebotomus argentipes TaxID=94469 RepID=UPI002892B67E|nr:ferritin light chain, oocyte isoform [Phlebotomus argentipes]XP_059612444.1 ferritin light chain, oocyte isoform [Phlebotomus argentipes]
MKIFAALVVIAFAIVGTSANKHCYADVENACNNNDPDDSLRNCNALYSGFEHAEAGMMEFTVMQIQSSFEYLLLSTKYNTHVKNRPGFSKKFRELSDRSWNHGIDLIKHITTRGGKMEFRTVEKPRLLFEHTLELDELQSMAIVLENEKFLAKTAHHIHQNASHANHSTHYDPEVAHYMEEKFIEDQADTIRQFSGYANDLKNFMKEKSQVALSIYLFDEYLQKQ